MPDYILTGEELARRCVDIAENYKTIYMYACYGFQVTDATIRNKAAQNLNGWYTQANINKLRAVANQSPPTWGFDCVNLIKGILWGWWGDEEKEKGGAKYATNGIPDTNADGMIARCSDVSSDFSEIAVGEAVWLKGHIGVYIGHGLCVECTPRWSNGVQITAVWNRGKQNGYNGRYWTKHGKIPHVDYGDGEISEDMPNYALGRRNLKRGSVGEDVVELQFALIQLGFTCGDAGADGDFGKATEKALIAFQTASGLVPDGIFGTETLSALKNALDRLSNIPNKEQTYTVLLRRIPQAEMEAMKVRWPDCEVTEE